MRPASWRTLGYQLIIGDRSAYVTPVGTNWLLKGFASGVCCITEEYSMLDSALTAGQFFAEATQ